MEAEPSDHKALYRRGLSCLGAMGELGLELGVQNS